MERDYDTTPNKGDDYSQEPDSEKSFVGKFKSIISNTPLSKWFKRQNNEDIVRTPVVRRRESIEDEDSEELQPPAKRAKLPESLHTVDLHREPVAGPSGLQSRKYMNSTHNVYSSSAIYNGNKDSDSEESTSGYSSVARIGSKEQVCDSQPGSKQTSPLQNSRRDPSNFDSKLIMSRSLFMEKTSSPTKNTSLSSRRPTFNASSFGSPNFIDNTLSTRNITNSPFYNGRTIYGGASAYGRNLGRSQSDLKNSLRSSITRIKPVNRLSNESVPLGKTARRILETLEQYSSPINDVKKVPVVSQRKDGGMLSKYVGANPYMVRGSKRELQVPTVADLLKMKQKTRLQESTEAVKQIATSSKSMLNVESYKLGGSVSVDEEKEKTGGKIKTKVTTAVRQRLENNEVRPEVNLPEISLPISTLPKFDLVIPVEVEKPPPQLKNVLKEDKTKETEKVVQKEQRGGVASAVEFKFSNPVVIAENIKSIVAINNFKFSEPKSANVATLNLNFKMPEKKLPSLIPKSKNNGENFIKTATVLKTGSVMDVLGKKSDNVEKPKDGFVWSKNALNKSTPVEEGKSKQSVTTAEPKSVTTAFEPKQPVTTGFGNEFKLGSNKWECSSCLVRNNDSDLKCVACTAPKSKDNKNQNPPPPPSPAVATFSSSFKAPSDTWECPVCMIRNKNELSKCAACEAPNPKKAPSTSTTTTVGFGEKFKPPEKSWECSACLVRNKEEATKCVACETSKPGSFGSTFSLQKDEWECDVCMVRNKSQNSKCQCCEASKPGSTKESGEKDKLPIAPFNFGIPSTATSFSFGIPPGAKSELPNIEQSPSIIFGEASKTSATAATSFSFGIPPPVSTTSSNDKVEATKTTTTSEVKLQNEDKPKVGFQFNSPGTEVKKTESVSKTVSSTKATFNFTPAAPASTNLFNKPSNQTGFSIPNFNFGAASKPLATASPLVPSTTGSSATKEDPSVSSTSLFKLFPDSQKIPAPTFGASSNNVSSTNNSEKKAEPTPAPAASENKLPSFTAPVGGFSFTSPAPTTPSFSFQAPKTVSNNVTQFGAVTTTQSGFNFGNAAATTGATRKVGFNFGATSSTPLQTSFNFGAATTSTPASTGGFNFSSSAAFDPNIKPSFNFSDGPVTSFSAQAMGGDGTSMAPRKIKRAVRRTQR